MAISTNQLTFFYFSFGLADWQCIGQVETPAEVIRREAELMKAVKTSKAFWVLWKHHPHQKKYVLRTSPQ